mgnify:CR=1 FL=1
MAGLSLGEYTALVAAGAMTFNDALAVVKVRAEAMHAAGQARPVRSRALGGLHRVLTWCCFAALGQNVDRHRHGRCRAEERM